MKELSFHVWEVGPEDVQLPRRDRNAHKGDFGRAVIVGGSVGYSGAPVMAANAAVRMGAGLVTVLVPEPVWPIAAAKLDSAMPFPLPAIPWVSVGQGRGTLSRLALDRALEHLASADAALVGPGMTRDPDAAWVARALVRQVKCPLVVDADGINALQGHIDILDKREDLTVLTPHDGEFSRLTGEAAPKGEGDRIAAARAFAAAHRCVLVLKGHRTVAAFPDGDAFINTTGNPGMAKGGSGDVLAGVLVSLLAQDLDPKEAVPWGVCLHGQAGDLAAAELGEYGMTPADLIDRLPAVTKRF